MAEPRVVAGRFVLDERLGHGGMGVVWRATDDLLGREVAVKQVHAHVGGAETLQDRLLREARAAARLNHPGAVTVHDVVSDGDEVFIVMELVRAPTLADLVSRDGPLAPPRVAAIGLGLLEVLEEAHRIGIVHRDVKPTNVMVQDRDRTKLADFGIARLSGDPTLTREGALLGSPAYMSPEQIRGERGDAATDLWALGATLYYAAEGTAAFGRPTYEASIAAVLTDVPPRSTRAGSALADLLSALLEKDPVHRPAPDDIRETLEQIATDPPGTAAPEPPEVTATPTVTPPDATSTPAPPTTPSPEPTASPPTEPPPARDDPADGTPDEVTVSAAAPPVPPPTRRGRRQVLITGAAVLVAIVLLAVPAWLTLRHRPRASAAGKPSPHATSWAAGSLVGRFPACGKDVAAVTVGGRPAVVSDCGNGTLKVNDLATGTLRRSLNASGTLLTAGPLGGRQVAVTSTSSNDDHAMVWDLTTGARVGKIFTRHTNGVTTAGLGTLNGRPVVVSGSYDSTVRTWDPITGKTVAPQVNADSEIISLVLTTFQGRRVAVEGGYGSTVRIWDLATGEQVGATFAGHLFKGATEYVESVVLGTVGGRAVAVSAGDDGTVQVSDLATGRRVGKPIAAAAQPGLAVAELGGRQVIVSAYRTDVVLWDLATHAPVHLPMAGPSSVVSLATTTLEGHQVVVTGNDDGTVAVWSLG